MTFINPNRHLQLLLLHSLLGCVRAMLLHDWTRGSGGYTQSCSLGLGD